MDQNYLTQDRNKWHAFVHTVMDLHIPQNTGIIMTEELLTSQEGHCFMEFTCYQAWKLCRIQTHTEGITVYWNGLPAAVQTDNASEELAAFLVLAVWCCNPNDSILTL
jgi:hypothetical protein